MLSWYIKLLRRISMLEKAFSADLEGFCRKLKQSVTGELTSEFAHSGSDDGTPVLNRMMAVCRDSEWLQRPGRVVVAVTLKFVESANSVLGRCHARVNRPNLDHLAQNRKRSGSERAQDVVLDI